MELSQQIRDFILPQSDQENYSHRTNSEKVVNKIMEEGFRFTDSFQKTTDEIIDDMVYINYWDTLRKHYGTYIVIISFNKVTLDIARKLIDDTTEIQQLLCVDSQEKDDEEIYLLPKEFIKGYVRRDDGRIFESPHFDPTYIPEHLSK